MIHEGEAYRKYRAAQRQALHLARVRQTPIFIFDLGGFPQQDYYISPWNDRTGQMTVVAAVLPNAITLERK